MKKALVIGRFQIVHNGHKDLFLQLKEKNLSEVLAVIGVAKEIGTPKDVFSGEECKKMLEPVLKEIGLNYSIYLVPDINNPPKYEQHVKSILGYQNNEKIILFSGNSYTYNCFKDKAYQILIPEKRVLTHANEIREMIADDNPEWEKHLPDSTISFLYENNGIEKIKKAYGGNKMTGFKNTADIIIECYKENEFKGIVLIQRRYDPFKGSWALPGGHLDKGETLEQAAVREALEETSLEVKLVRQLGTYSGLDRDPRGHVISTAYIARAEGEPVAKSDAVNAKIFSLDELPDKLAFDHEDILKDYLKVRENGN